MSATIGERVRDARVSAGLTQAQLAERMGKKQQDVSLVESGAAKLVGLELARAFALALNLSLDYLANGDGIAHPDATPEPEQVQA